MSNILKTSFVCGVILTLIGCFLPWQQGGDFISYWTYGIRIFPSFQDNGGLLIILLTLNALMLIFRPLNFITKPLMWSIVSGFVLVLVSFFHIAKLVISRANESGTIGAPMIEVGLVMVSVGSILLLSALLIYYHKSTQ